MTPPPKRLRHVVTNGRGRWTARYWVDGRQVIIGTYDSEAAACAAVAEADKDAYLSAERVVRRSYDRQKRRDPVNLWIRLERSERDDIREISAITGVTMNEIVRRAIRTVIARYASQLRDEK